jgi:hypothetical protein
MKEDRRVLPATMNVYAGLEGEGTLFMVPVGAEPGACCNSANPKPDRGSGSCARRLRLLAKQMLRHADQCGLMKSSCRCMEIRSDENEPAM